MAWLNYHHLLYFWTVAREGSITRACEVLHLTQPAVSAQLRTFQRTIGQPLLERRGRGLVLTEVGRVVYRYADEIFTLGRELQETLARGVSPDRPARFVAGIVEGLPKLLAFRLLEPALGAGSSVQLVVREGTAQELMAELAMHTVDVVLSDAPIPPGLAIRAFSHGLGECGVTFFGAARFARLRRHFPRSLDDAPFLLPGESSALRRPLEDWFAAQGVRPRIAGEIADSAVLKVFGQAGAGVFAAPTVVEAEVKRQYAVRVLGRIDDVRERFYAISAERRIRHPAVQAVTTAARRDLFSSPLP